MREEERRKIRDGERNEKRKEKTLRKIKYSELNN
jgi:hypothetical protein